MSEIHYKTVLSSLILEPKRKRNNKPYLEQHGELDMLPVYRFESIDKLNRFYIHEYPKYLICELGINMSKFRRYWNYNLCIFGISDQTIDVFRLTLSPNITQPLTLMTRIPYTMLNRYVYIGLDDDGWHVGFDENVLLSKCNNPVTISKVSLNHIGGPMYYLSHDSKLDQELCYDKLDLIPRHPDVFYDFCMSLIIAEVHKYDKDGKLTDQYWWYGDKLQKSYDDFMDPEKFQAMFNCNCYPIYWENLR